MSQDKSIDINTENTKNAPKCGIIMPISSIDTCPAEHWQDVLRILQEAIADAGYEANLVSDADNSGIIQKRIVQNLYDNDIVVCDVSCKNPNVMFELGMRLAFDKPTIIIIDDKTSYSFDTAIIEHLSYPRDLRYGKINEFKIKLKEKIIATIKKSENDPNYTTFLKQFGEFKVAKIEEKTGTKDEVILSLLNDLTNDIGILKKRVSPIFSDKYTHPIKKMEKIKILIREGIDDYCKNYNIEECDICRNVPKIEKLVDFLEQNPELRFLCGDRRTLFEITDKSLVPF